MDQDMSSIVRVGVVSKVNGATGTVKVSFPDLDIVSDDLPVVVPQTLNNKFYTLPDVGEQVLCVFLPHGNSHGFVLGAYYNKTIKPAVTSPDKQRLDFSDGGYLEYDRKTHALTVNSKGTVALTGSVTVTGDISITGNLSITGNVAVNGDITCTKNIVADGYVKWSKPGGGGPP